MKLRAMLPRSRRTRLAFEASWIKSWGFSRQRRGLRAVLDFLLVRDFLLLPMRQLLLVVRPLLDPRCAPSTGRS